MARSKSTRPSYCLNHQEREATSRCQACLKPLCEDCTLITDLGNFCGSECHEKRIASNERVQRLRLEDEAQRIPRMIRRLLSYAFTLLLLVAVIVGWQHLPKEWRAPVEGMFKKSTPAATRHN